ncbi:MULTISPECIES: MotA/TolQ/ExbB proton channel family protein [Spongiibacter]|uniref:MotA/TolQ/ExbB proton channel family protein n=2 Tax=Spongiibacteraceae TaxID=1706375 RepID=UPI0019600EB0|nr:MotA/TolQ/ExbB proton channel family protein [Spongiibacter sp. UBA1325]MBM7422727.1 biopolymer transport protein ExbB [Spongiibacter marinus]MEE2653246.1 MotA/TolQ/ExbB proton channel family protein [Pseudomonadota bacterium]
MLELVKAGGWLMLPIILSSILALAICVERFLALNPDKVAPRNLLNQVWGWMQNKQLDNEKLRQLRKGSPLGEIIAAGLGNAKHGRDIMKESIEDAASHVIHELERYLNALGTIAAVTPLLGLLGTVVGMIRVFSEIMVQGTGNAGVLAGGISEALITTASGLCVAIPALIMHRYFLRRIDAIVVTMEQDTIKLINAVHGDVQMKENSHSGRSA